MTRHEREALIQADARHSEDLARMAAQVRHECSQRVMPTHFTWSVEKNDCCPKCGGKTALVAAKAWAADSENDNHPDLAGEHVEVHEEVTGHWCPECEILCSLSFNS